MKCVLSIFHFRSYRAALHCVCAVEKFRLNYLSDSLHRRIRDLCAVAKMRFGFDFSAAAAAVRVKAN